MFSWQSNTHQISNQSLKQTKFHNNFNATISKPAWKFFKAILILDLNKTYKNEGKIWVKPPVITQKKKENVCYWGASRKLFSASTSSMKL